MTKEGKCRFGAAGDARGGGTETSLLDDCDVNYTPRTPAQGFFGVRYSASFWKGFHSVS